MCWLRICYVNPRSYIIRSVTGLVESRVPRFHYNVRSRLAAAVSGRRRPGPPLSLCARRFLILAHPSSMGIIIMKRLSDASLAYRHRHRPEKHAPARLRSPPIFKTIFIHCIHCAAAAATSHRNALTLFGGALPFIIALLHGVFFAERELNT